MNFLEAKRVVDGFQGGESLNFLFANSGLAEPFELFFKAAAAKNGRTARARTLPFNTLAQGIATPPIGDETEVFLLMPWDLVPELDWRSGVVAAPADRPTLEARATDIFGRIAARGQACQIYLPAETPPLFSDPGEDAALAANLVNLARISGANILPADTFALGAYLASGCPVPGTQIGAVAEVVIDSALGMGAPTSKLLITDLDNVLWHGVLAEDGRDGIACAPEGIGYRHFLYQTMLKKLQGDGVVLAAVSRNDPADVSAALTGAGGLLHEDDFVCVIASYNAKSAQIREIAAQLNLAIDSIVYVDDNPVELAEITAALPAVVCLRFPEHDEDLPSLFRRLARAFARDTVTDEDIERTALYRRRLAGIAPVNETGGDLTEFLRGLDMELVVRDRSTGDRTRAVQLINKTNQFNLNGRQFADDEIGAILSAGGRLWTASLEDRTGSHGEVLCCLIGPDGIIEALVLSCRVFQRRVEYAFLAWIAGLPDGPRLLRFQATARNEPLRRFLAETGIGEDSQAPLPFDAARFAADHRDALDLFRVVAP